METQFKVLRRRLFEEGGEGRSILLIDRAERAGELFAREACGWAERRGEPCLVLTHRPAFWASAVPPPSTRQATGLDLGRAVAAPQFVQAADAKGRSVDELFERLKQFHDNDLTSPDDARVFRLISDAEELLDWRFLTNLRGFSRKANIGCWVVAREADASKMAFFDIVLRLEVPPALAGPGLALVHVLKGEDYSGFDAPAEALRAGRRFLCSREKDAGLFFRDIDYTEIV